MAEPSIQTRSPAFLEAYAKVDGALRVRQVRLYLILALVLVPACAGLDYFVYPRLLGPIFAIRLLCDLAMLPCLFALATQAGQRRVTLLSKVTPLAPCISICWMIYATEGVFSSYYAGINIVLVGVILLIPYTLREAGLICGIVTVFYTLACLLHHTAPSGVLVQGAAATHTASAFINNIYFLGMTTVIALCSCHYSSKHRLEEFRLRFELDVNNRELASTLAKLKETEVQLVQSEKMNALGKLSAGLLHEINNPLNFTFMALQIAQQDSADNQDMLETLKDIGEGMSRIKSVISDLRAFAYPTQDLQAEEFSLDEVLTTALRLTAHEIGSIVIDRQEVQNARALGSATQIVHVLMNLIVNAAHALKGVSREEGARIKVSCAVESGRIRVSVLDNGLGVSAANLPKLLDPFFTTKAPGEGMGLGLSICHTIVKNHGGAIRILSQPGEWTDVSFDLAVATAMRSAA